MPGCPGELQHLLVNRFAQILHVLDRLAAHPRSACRKAIGQAGGPLACERTCIASIAASVSLDRKEPSSNSARTNLKLLCAHLLAVLPLERTPTSWRIVLYSPEDVRSEMRQPVTWAYHSGTLGRPKSHRLNRKGLRRLLDRRLRSPSPLADPRWSTPATQQPYQTSCDRCRCESVSHALEFCSIN